jgi:hypothetical protein
MATNNNKKSEAPFPTWSFDGPCPSMEWSELSTASLVVQGDKEETEEDFDLILVGIAAPKADSTTDAEATPVVLTGAARDIDQQLDGALTDLMQECVKTFKNGTLGATTPTLRVVGGTTTKKKTTRHVLLGLGNAKDGDETNRGHALGKAVADKLVAEKNVVKAKVIWPFHESNNSSATLLSDFSTAFYSSLHADHRYRGVNSEKAKNIPAQDLQRVVLAIGTTTVDGADSAIEQGRLLARGVLLTKVSVI